MIENKFTYAFIDGSWILTRNAWIATKDKSIEEMNPGDICRITLQTISKLYKDWECSADKPIVIFDEWSRDLGGYIRTWMMREYGEYKGTRQWMTQAKLDAMRNDPNVTPEEIKAAEHELAANKCKQDAKKIMKAEFGKIGIPVFSVPGYEFDDIATLASFMLNGVTEKKNVIVAKDSDLSWSLCPGCVQFLPPLRGVNQRFVEYDEMYHQVPEVLTARGVGPYMYHAYCDSLGVTGHNDNVKTIKPRCDGTETILKILDGDYSNVENPDAFKAQFNSFDLGNFPDLDRVKDLIMNVFPKAGHIGSTLEFRNFCNTYKVDISDLYYMAFSDRLERKMFSE